MKATLTFLTIIFFSSQLFAQWTTSGSNVYYNGGNVGIGTSSPSIWFGGPPTVLEISSIRPVLKLNSQSSTGLNTLVFTNSSVNGTTHNGEFHINHQFDAIDNSKSLLRFGTYPAGDAMVVRSDGNVGIGIVNPTNTLHIQGSTRFGVSSGLPSNATANNSSNYVEKYGLKMTSSNNGFYISLSTSVNERKVYLQSGHESSTYAYGIGPICINPFGGNVGIGSTNPDSKLTVKGTVHAEEVKVDLSVPGPDYVFEEDYDLRSLEEIESYVKQNKHLPDVPSAMEMEEEGIKVGEMNMLLLRKIEEMTLHMIEQSKQLNDMNQLIINQQSENQHLKSRLEQLETLLKN